MGLNKAPKKVGAFVTFFWVLGATKKKSARHFFWFSGCLPTPTRAREKFRGCFWPCASDLGVDLRPRAPGKKWGCLFLPCASDFGDFLLPRAPEKNLGHFPALFFWFLRRSWALFFCFCGHFFFAFPGPTLFFWNAFFLVLAKRKALFFWYLGSGFKTSKIGKKRIL